MSRNVFCLVPVVALVAFLYSARAGDVNVIEKEARASLAGLEGVHLVVEDVGPPGEELGVTSARLQTDGELRLRKGGVRILTNEEFVRTPGRPYLYVRVNCTLASQPALKGVTFFTCDVQLTQACRLDRDPNVRLLIATWERRSGGLVGSANLRESVRNHLADLVDDFVNAYLAANGSRNKAPAVPATQPAMVNPLLR